MPFARLFPILLTLPAFAQLPATAQTSTGPLTGKMAAFNYVFGAPWKCTTNVPAMAGQPARTVNSTATFEAVPNNVMHVHIAGDQYTAEQYFGYSTQANMYWSASSDTMGMGISEASADGKTYKGAAGVGTMSGTITDTYTKAAGNRVTIHSVTVLGGRQDATDTTCTR